MTLAPTGLLVTLDGPGGAGKTTTAHHLRDLLTRQGHRVYVTTQPSYGELGQIARRIVVCDRYVAASLVLQRMDGVPIEFITAINAEVDVPDLSVILTVDPAVAARRIDTRGTRHRFETGSESSAREAELYVDATRRLAMLGYPLLTINTTYLRPDQVAEQIANRIANLTACPTTRPATA